MIKNHMPTIEEQNTAYSHPSMGKEEILERLRQGGYRITRQRIVLLDVILESECSCCKEIYFQVHKRMPQMGIATIYRMLNTLEEVGAIKRKSIYQICAQDNFQVEEGLYCGIQWRGTDLSLQREFSQSSGRGNEMSGTGERKSGTAGYCPQFCIDTSAFS